MGAPVATFNNTMAEMALELSEREIYNDIRSQIDVTEIVFVVDAEAEYDAKQVLKYFAGLSAGASADVTVKAVVGYPVIQWLRAEARGRPWGPTTTEYLWLDAVIVEEYADRCVVRVTNNTGYPMYDNYLTVWYEYQLRPGQQHEETLTSTMTVRSTDETSVSKYGRRVMNLVWPLGQSQAQMQTLCDAYCDRYSEPVVMLTMMLKGSTDALIVQILTRKVSEKITVQNTRLGLNDDFFINTVEIGHDVNGILQSRYLLEQVRAMEETTFFTLDTSALDGTHVLGY